MTAILSRRRWAGKQRGEITPEEFREIENLAEPCVGSCAMLGTANTMGCMAEAMGMSLPGSAVIPAVYAKRMQAAYETGRAVMDLVKSGITARDVITRKSVENAIAVLMATGGPLMESCTSRRSIERRVWGTFPGRYLTFSRKVPQIASVYPASPYDMVDFYEAGGVQAVMKELGDLCCTADCITVTGESRGREFGDGFVYRTKRGNKDSGEPFHRDGGVAVLTGKSGSSGRRGKAGGNSRELDAVTAERKSLSE